MYWSIRCQILLSKLGVEERACGKEGLHIPLMWKVKQACGLKVGDRDIMKSLCWVRWRYPKATNIGWCRHRAGSFPLLRILRSCRTASMLDVQIAGVARIDFNELSSTRVREVLGVSASWWSISRPVLSPVEVAFTLAAHTAQSRASARWVWTFAVMCW